MNPIMQQLLQAPLLPTLGRPKLRPPRLKSRRQLHRPVHQALVQIHEPHPFSGRDLPRRLGVRLADGRAPDGLRVAERLAARRRLDLVDGRRRDDVDARRVAREGGVRDDIAEVLFVAEQWDVLARKREVYDGVVGTQEDELWVC